jgi:hypothetical protein
VYETARRRPGPNVCDERTKTPGVRAAVPARAAGHAFSLSALRDAREAPAPPIQRKVGFEVEYAVPSYGNYDFPITLQNGNDVSEGTKKRVKAFLFGGIAYKTALGGNESFKLTADHNGIVSREPLRAAIAQRGKLDPPGSTDADASSNLEYVTPPIDELAKGSDKKFDTQIGALTSHLDDTFTKAKGPTLQVLTAPATGVATGSEATSLESWLPSEDFAAVKGALDTFRGNITDECYLQATAGVLPSAMRKLFKTDTNEGGIFSQGGAIPQLYAATQAVGAAVDAELPELEYCKKLSKDGHLQSLRALSGLTYLLASYLVGEAASQTSAFPGGTIKNAVPFLIKVDPKSLVDAATMELNLFQRLPDPVIDKIASTILAREEITVEYWTGLGYEPRERKKDDRVTAGTVRNLTLMFLRGEKPALTGTQTGGEQLKQHDDMPWQETEFQSGVPLEYRYIAERPKAAGLKTALLAIIEQVRELNLSQFPEDKREPIRTRVKE